MGKAVYANNEKNKASSTRDYNILVPGIWQNTIRDRLWEDHTIKCDFKFAHGRLHKKTPTAKMDGELHKL